LTQPRHPRRSRRRLVPLSGRPGTGTAPGNLPFGELANLLVTPHSSGITTDTFAGRADDIAANIGRLARGEPLRSVVVPG
jgi:phosphoglycerate dehydrogenase-like enzyme